MVDNSPSTGARDDKTTKPLLQGAQCAGLRSLLLNFAFNMSLLQQFVGVLNTGAGKGKKRR